MQVDPADLGSGLVTLQDGLGTLVTALVHRLSVSATLRLDWPVHSVDWEDGGWTLNGGGLPRFLAEAIILALPAPRSALLLAHEFGPVPALASLPHISSVTVSLAFLRSDVEHPLDASGFVVANPDQHGLRACVFCSSKFARRAPPGADLVRAFFRPESEELKQPDGHWVEKATRALEAPLSLSGGPLQGWVSRWPDALPQYPRGHAETIAELRRELQSFGGLELAGTGVDQGGVDGAVRSGQAATDRVLASLSKA
jgi:oxygen-dependent protoporphyrinogen oxidase